MTLAEISTSVGWDAWSVAFQELIRRGLLSPDCQNRILDLRAGQTRGWMFLRGKYGAELTQVPGPVQLRVRLTEAANSLRITAEAYGGAPVVVVKAKQPIQWNWDASPAPASDATAQAPMHFTTPGATEGPADDDVDVVRTGVSYVRQRDGQGVTVAGEEDDEVGGAEVTGGCSAAAGGGAGGFPIAALGLVGLRVRRRLARG